MALASVEHSVDQKQDHERKLHRWQMAMPDLGTSRHRTVDAVDICGATKLPDTEGSVEEGSQRPVDRQIARHPVSRTYTLAHRGYQIGSAKRPH